MRGIRTAAKVPQMAENGKASHPQNEAARKIAMKEA
jgi:hypothetical protein